LRQGGRETTREAPRFDRGEGQVKITENMKKQGQCRGGGGALTFNPGVVPSKKTKKLANFQERNAENDGKRKKKYLGMIALLKSRNSKSKFGGFELHSTKGDRGGGDRGVKFSLWKLSWGGRERQFYLYQGKRTQ